VEVQQKQRHIMFRTTGGEGRVVGWSTSAAVVPLMTSI